MWTRTYQPTPETLNPVPRRRLVVRVCLDLLQAADEVHVFGLDHWCAEIQLRADVKDGEQHEWKVVGDEAVDLPMALQEHAPARELLDADD